MTAIPYRGLRNGWKPPDEQSEGYYELAPTSSSFAQGFRLGLYSVATYESLLIAEFFACSRIYIDQCLLTSSDLRTLLLAAFGALGGLSFVHPRYKFSTPGRSALANAIAITGGASAVCIARSVAGIVIDSLTRTNVIFDEWWARSLVSCVVASICSSAGWHIVDTYLPGLLELYDEHITSIVNHQIADEEVQWLVHQRDERCKGAPTGWLAEQVRLDEIHERKKKEAKEKAANQLPRQTTREAPQTLTQSRLILTEEDKQAEEDAKELATLPETYQTLEEKTRDVEDALNMKMREFEEAAVASAAAKENDFVKTLEEIATKDDGMQHAAYARELKRKDVKPLLESQRAYQHYRQRHYGRREVQLPEKNTRGRIEDLIDYITPFGPRPKKKTETSPPRAAPRPYSRDLVGEVTDSAQLLQDSVYAMPVRRQGEHTMGGLFDTNTYLSAAAKKQVREEELRRRRMDAMAHEQAMREEDPDYGLVQEEEVDEMPNEVPSYSYTPLTDPGKVPRPKTKALRQRAGFLVPTFSRLEELEAARESGELDEAMRELAGDDEEEEEVVAAKEEEEYVDEEEGEEDEESREKEPPKKRGNKAAQAAQQKRQQEMLKKREKELLRRREQLLRAKRAAQQRREQEEQEQEEEEEAYGEGYEEEGGEEGVEEEEQPRKKVEKAKKESSKRTPRYAVEEQEYEEEEEEEEGEEEGYDEEYEEEEEYDEEEDEDYEDE